jgi:hypothetical protein
MKPKPRREAQLSPSDAMRVYKVSLVAGCLVLSWSGREQGIKAFTGSETIALYRFLHQYRNEISPH